MLILQRKLGEAIKLYLGDELLGTVRVVAFRKNQQVRLGFDFPDQVTINREELEERMVDDE